LGENVRARHFTVELIDSQVLTVSELFIPKPDAQRHDLYVEADYLVLGEITGTVTD
jgi:hypothetical protein